MRRPSFLLFVLVACLIGFACAPAWAQQGADLTGVVQDSSGAPMVGVQLRATNAATNVSRSTVSLSDGAFAFRFLSPGRYTINAEMTGFTKVTMTGIVIQEAIGSNVTVTLKPAPVQDSITVTAEANTVETGDATVKFSMTNEMVSGLPIFTSAAGRTVLDQLPFLLPGITFGSTLGSDSQGMYISVNGGRTGLTSYNFDGGDNNDPEYNRAASSLPNPDAIQEITVVTNNYRADMGRSMGGSINAVSKSGTNIYHGNFRYFMLNEALNARGFFDPRRLRQRLNTYGGQLGGPVYIPKLFKGKDRTHFFFDLEGNRSSRTMTFNRDMYSAAERAGDFSLSAVKPKDPLTGQLFPNNQIPTSRYDPIANTILTKWIPAPNYGVRNYMMIIPSSDQTYQYTIRLEHKITEHDQIGGTFFRTPFNQDSGSTTNLPVPSKQNSESFNRNIVFRETHTFSARAVNQFVGTFTRFNSTFLTAGAADGISAKELGFTGIRPQIDKFPGPPTIVVSGTGIQFAAGSGTLSGRTATQIKDDLSYTRRHHAMKFGGEYRSYVLTRDLGSSGIVGSFSFSAANSYGASSALADFLLGLPNQYYQSTGITYSPRQHAYNFYALDDWKVKPNLTLNLGLRYELVPPILDPLDQVSVFRPGAKSVKLPNAPLGFLYVGDPDPILGTVPRGTYPTDTNNIAPRFGLAWSPRIKDGLLHTLMGDGKTSIRTGAGLFYEQVYGQAFSQFSSTQPFQIAQTVTASQIYGVAGTFANPFGTGPNPWPFDMTKRTFTGSPTGQDFDPTFRTGYNYQYNFTIQRQFKGGILAEVGYVGTNSFKLMREFERNYALLGPGATTGNVQTRRIYPYAGSITEKESTGRANYNSLQTRVSRRFKSGLYIDGNYVWARSLDNGSNPQVSQLVFTYFDRWGRSSNDRKHAFNLSYTYELRLKSGNWWVKRAFEGWGLGGATRFWSGIPMDISQSADTTLTGKTLNGRGTLDQVGPWKRLDPRKLQIRADINNLFNHANFAVPNTIAGNSTFGQISTYAYGNGRNIQLTARYEF